MKRFISILIVILVLASSVSCSKEENSQGENNFESSSASQSETTSKSTENSESSNSTDVSQEENLYLETDGCKWDTKEVSEPEFDNCEIKEVVVLNHNGSDVTTKLVVTPFQLKDFDLSKTKEELKKNVLFKDWIFGLEDSEFGNVTLYTDVGSKTSYEWQKSIVGESNSESTIFNDLVVSYKGNTEMAEGYTRIAIEIDIPKEKVNDEIQTDMLGVLKAVYGDELGEYICYAPLKSGNLLCEFKQQGATISLRRSISETGIKSNRVYSFFFAILVEPLISAGNTFEGFEGEGEYTSLVSTPEYVFDIFNPAIGSFNVKEYETICSELFSKYYSNYENVLPNNGYSYSVLNGENGIKSIDVSLNAAVGVKDLGKLFCQNFNVEYSVSLKDDVVTNVGGKFYCGVGTRPSKDADSEQYKKELLEKGIEMMETITNEKFSIDEFVYDENNKLYKTDKREMTILGIKKNVDFTFEFGTTMGGFDVGYITINISSF